MLWPCVPVAAESCQPRLALTVARQIRGSPSTAAPAWRVLLGLTERKEWPDAAGLTKQAGLSRYKQRKVSFENPGYAIGQQEGGAPRGWGCAATAAEGS